MKRLISAAASAVMAISAVTFPTASAKDYHADKNAESSGFVVLGDSIASGYGLSDSEYNYGELIADYYGGRVDNFAHAGDDTDDLLALLESPSAEMSSALSDADTVIISIGGNDMIHYATRRLLRVCANANVLKAGYTADDIPEEPSFSDVNIMLDRDALKEFASSTQNRLALNSSIQSIRAGLTMTSENNSADQYDRVIETQIIPNIETAVSKIQAVNPDAEIIVQTVYDPVQFDPVYYAANYTGNSAVIMNLLIPVFTAVTESFRDQLTAKNIQGVTVADVYNDITSLDENGNKYGWYFTRMQNERKDMDFHPTQAGHVAIAVNIINTIGETREDGGLLRQTFINLSDNDSYPAAALAEYDKVKGLYLLGDLNADNKIDSNDATAVLKEYSALSTGGGSFTEIQKKTADTNFDGKVDSTDSSEILRYYAFASTGGKGSFKNFKAEK